MLSALRRAKEETEGHLHTPTTAAVETPSGSTSGGGGGGSSSVPHTPAGSPAAAATTPFNSPVFHPHLYSQATAPAPLVNFEALFPPTAMQMQTPAAIHQQRSMSVTQLQQLQQLQSLQAQLMQHQTMQSQQQAVYATPAAWHKRRQFLANQPTPQAIDVLASAAPATRTKAHRVAPSPMLPPGLTRAQSLSHAIEPSPSPTGRLHRRTVSSCSLASPPTSVAGATTTSSSTNLAHVQASLRHLKRLQLQHEEEKATAIQKSRIQQTFLSLSSFLIVLFVGALCYYDYLLLSPHIGAICWAGLFWILLDAPQKWLLRCFALLDARFLDHYARRIEVTLCVATVLLGLVVRAQLSSLLALGGVFATLSFLLLGDRHSVTAVLLLFVLLLLIAFPLFLFTKTCVLESQEIAARLRAFIESNSEFQHILEDFSTSSTFIGLQNYCRGWGYEIPTTSVEQLRDWILRSFSLFADQLTLVVTSVYGLLTNVGNLLVSLVTFASMLYFLLASNRNFHGTLTWLSPFSADDNARLVQTLKRSIESIFVCSCCVGLVHIIVTYVSFSLCGIDLCFLLSLVSGFAAMLPIFSSWIIWLPACGFLLLTGQPLHAVTLCAIQMTLLFYVDPLIMSNVPGNSYVIGLSIVTGVYTFGAAGVLIGPLLAGVSFTLLSIYRDYISLPLYTAAAPGVPPNPMPSPTSEFVLPSDSTMATMEDALSYGSFPAPSPIPAPAPSPSQRIAEMGSLSTAHSTNSLAQLASGLQAVADAQQPSSEATTPQSARDFAIRPLPSSPVLSPMLSLTTPSTSRTLRFNTPLQSSRGPTAASSPATPSTAARRHTAIVEGDDETSEPELEIELPEVESEISSLGGRSSPSSLDLDDLDPAHQSLLAAYEAELEQAQRLHEFEQQREALQLESVFDENEVDSHPTKQGQPSTHSHPTKQGQPSTQAVVESGSELLEAAPLETAFPRSPSSSPGTQLRQRPRSSQ